MKKVVDGVEYDSEKAQLCRDYAISGKWKEGGATLTTMPRTLYLMRNEAGGIFWYVVYADGDEDIEVTSPQDADDTIEDYARRGMILEGASTYSPYRRSGRRWIVKAMARREKDEKELWSF